VNRHLLDIADLDVDELRAMLSLAERPDLPHVLAGKGVALVFEKPSNRTRHSMEMAVVQLGGHPVYTRGEEVGLDVREPVEDVTRVMAGYHAILAARVFEHSVVERMAAVSTVPVVNMLSDHSHPLQALADLLTMAETFGGVDALAGRTVAYIGDGNNVARSLALGAGMLGMSIRLATPEGYELSAEDSARIIATGADFEASNSPQAAVAGASVVYTDVWASMGRESEAVQRRADFSGFTIDDILMAQADDEAIFLHCLPAHRGEEVTDEVLEGQSSRVWLQAENRMHAARGALVWLMEHR